jgi:Zn-dependent oligopeptidase
MLTQTHYTELSDLNTIESDAANLNNNLFEKFVFVPEIIKLVSAHSNTGEALPNDILKRLENGIVYSILYYINDYFRYLLNIQN